MHIHTRGSLAGDVITRTFVGKKKRGLRNIAYFRIFSQMEDNFILIPRRSPSSACAYRMCYLYIYIYAVINVMSLLSHSQWHIPISARLRRES